MWISIAPIHLWEAMLMSYALDSEQHAWRLIFVAVVSAARKDVSEYNASNIPEHDAKGLELSISI